MEKELECKVFVDDFYELMDRIIDLGAKIISHEIQENILIESSRFDTIEEYDYLRIRIAKDIYNNTERKYLTYKKKISDTNIRHFDEYTIEFDNLDNLKSILNFIGFDKQNSSKKERKSFEFMNARFDFDVWDKNFYPYPYIEIEVKEEKDLDIILNRLNISKEKITTKSISELKELLVGKN